jgi:nucleotide-binding universal stress UspA family protein
VYTAFLLAADSSLLRTPSADRQGFYEQLQVTVREIAQSDGVEPKTELLEGVDVDAVIQLLHRREAELLVIGLHRHTSHISRLCNSVFEIAQNALCSVLGVH